MLCSVRLASSAIAPFPARERWQAQAVRWHALPGDQAWHAGAASEMGKGHRWGDEGWQGESARPPDEQATDTNGERHGLSAHQAVALEDTVGASCTDPHIPIPEKGGLASSPTYNAWGLYKSSSMSLLRR